MASAPGVRVPPLTRLAFTAGEQEEIAKTPVPRTASTLYPSRLRWARKCRASTGTAALPILASKRPPDGTISEQSGGRRDPAFGRKSLTG
jgi:hypothetical protein